MDVQPVVLEGRHVRLEPLSLDHHAQLCRVGLDGDLLRWTESYTPTVEGVRQYIETALAVQARGSALPFAVVSKDVGQAIGSTRYGNIDRANRRVEIGWTWYGRDYQRTAVNTESKYLLLRHAFETLGCIRVDGAQDRCPERAIQKGHPADRRQRGGHLSPSHPHAERPHPGHRVLQHHRRRVARREGAARGNAGSACHARGRRHRKSRLNVLGDPAEFPRPPVPRDSSTRLGTTTWGTWVPVRAPR